MFTKNWYKVSASYYFKQEVDVTNVIGSSYKSSTDTWTTFGNTQDNVLCPSLYHVRTAYNSYGGVVLGTGTTQPTIDDYCLSGNLITNISCIAAVSNAGDADGVTTTAVYTVTNTSSEDITIGEIGIIASYRSSQNSQTYKLLLERTVLDAPITIPAGGVGQVTYTIRFNYPSA